MLVSKLLEIALPPTRHLQCRNATFDGPAATGTASGVTRAVGVEPGLLLLLLVTISRPNLGLVANKA